MDVPIAPSIHAARTRALELGDAGYPAGTAYAETVRASPPTGGDGGVDIAGTAIVPDVMMKTPRDFFISDEIHAPRVLSAARFTSYLSVVGVEGASAVGHETTPSRDDTLDLLQARWRQCSARTNAVVRSRRKSLAVGAAASHSAACAA
jgi:cystathionine beta-lyase